MLLFELELHSASASRRPFQQRGHVEWAMIYARECYISYSARTTGTSLVMSKPNESVTAFETYFTHLV